MRLCVTARFRSLSSGLECQRKIRRQISTEKLKFVVKSQLALLFCCGRWMHMIRVLLLDAPLYVGQRGSGKKLIPVKS